MVSYTYGEKQYSSYQDNYIQNSQFHIIYSPIRYFDKVSCSISFSNGNNNTYMPHINYGFSATSEFIEDFFSRCVLIYMGKTRKSYKIAKSNDCNNKYKENIKQLFLLIHIILIEL